MTILQIYNQQRSLFGGEEQVVNTIRDILEKHGHETSLLMRSSRGADRDLGMKLKTAVQGIYNPIAYRDMLKYLDEEQPDIVHSHNVYPNFSPSVLAACRVRKVPVVFHVHCHSLTCPNWYHLRNGKTCDLCFGGNEQWCLVANCRGSLPESAVYALRSFVARKFRLFQNNVTLFIAVSNFVRDRLVLAGYPANQIEVVQNAVCVGAPTGGFTGDGGAYVGYAGRLSFEKGADTLVQAARLCGLPVKIAGDGPEMDRLRALAPSNVEFLGRMSPESIVGFYGRSRFIVVPSRCYETFSLAAAEAMMLGRPVVASRIGALPELIEDGTTGVLFGVGNHEELALKMRLLWEDQGLCARIGEAASIWAKAHCHEDVFYQRLMTVYKRAIWLAKVGSGADVVGEEARLQQSPSGAIGADIERCQEALRR